MGNLGAKKNKGILIFLYSLFFAGAKKNLKNLILHPPDSIPKSVWGHAESNAVDGDVQSVDNFIHPTARKVSNL